MKKEWSSNRLLNCDTGPCSGLPYLDYLQHKAIRFASATGKVSAITCHYQWTGLSKLDSSSLWRCFTICQSSVGCIYLNVQYMVKKESLECLLIMAANAWWVYDLIPVNATFTVIKTSFRLNLLLFYLIWYKSLEGCMCFGWCIKIFVLATYLNVRH